MATAELARWNGPVAEASDPYDGGTSCSGLPPIAHVQNVLFLPDRTGPTDNDTIKWALTNYGAVYTGMYADNGMSTTTPTSDYYNTDHATPTTTTAPAPPTTPSTSSAGTTPTPARTSPTAARQTAPSSCATAGARARATAATSTSLYDDAHDRHEQWPCSPAKPATDYAQNLGYDKLGFTDTLSATADDTAWMAAAFTPSGDSPLEAASFYAQSPRTRPTRSTWARTSTTRPLDRRLASGTIDVCRLPHRPVFDQSCAGPRPACKFYVIVRLTTPTTEDPIPLEDAEPARLLTAYEQGDDGGRRELHRAPTARPAPGPTSARSPVHRADVCLKVFAGTPTPDLVKPVTRALAAVKVTRGRYATLRYRVNDSTPNDKEKVTVKIRNRAGRVVKSLALGWHAPNVALSVRYHCLLARGAYHFYVYATDRWGNLQTSIGHAALTVK